MAPTDRQFRWHLGAVETVLDAENSIMFFVTFLLISGHAPASLTVEDRVELVDVDDHVQERGVVGTNVITVFLDTARLLVENVGEALLDLGLSSDEN